MNRVYLTGIVVPPATTLRYNFHMFNRARRIAGGVFEFVFRSHFVVSGASMAPCLRSGDRVHVIPMALRIGYISRGAVVVLRPPEHDPRFDIKRVVGMPGEHVRIDQSNTVFIDDVLAPESYLDAENQGPTAWASQWICGENEYFVMGDNRSDSLDSRRYGPVSIRLILGAVWLKWPPGSLRPARMDSTQPKRHLHAP